MAFDFIKFTHTKIFKAVNRYEFTAFFIDYLDVTVKLSSINFPVSPSRLIDKTPSIEKL